MGAASGVLLQQNIVWTLEVVIFIALLLVLGLGFFARARSLLRQLSLGAAITLLTLVLAGTLSAERMPAPLTNAVQDRTIISVQLTLDNEPRTLAGEPGGVLIQGTLSEATVKGNRLSMSLPISIHADGLWVRCSKDSESQPLECWGPLIRAILGEIPLLLEQVPDCSRA